MTFGRSGSWPGVPVTADRLDSHLTGERETPSGRGQVGGVSQKLAPEDQPKLLGPDVLVISVPGASVAAVTFHLAQAPSTMEPTPRQNASPAGCPDERMDHERSQNKRICVRQERHCYAQPSAQIVGRRAVISESRRLWPLNSPGCDPIGWSAQPYICTSSNLGQRPHMHVAMRDVGTVTDDHVCRSRRFPRTNHGILAVLGRAGWRSCS